MQQLIQRKSECIVTVPYPASCKPVTYHLLCKQRGTLPLFDIFVINPPLRKTLHGTYYSATSQYIPRTPTYPQLRQIIPDLIHGNPNALRVTYQPYCKICGRKLTHPRSIALGECQSHSRPDTPRPTSCKSVKLIHTNKE